jgi:integrase
LVKRRHFHCYLTPFFGSQRLDSVSSFTVDRYKRRRIHTGARNGTINLELATLSHLMNCAIEWGWIKTRPCKIKLLEREQGRILALTDDEADALLQGALTDDDPSCWLFVAFGLNTAIRHREILRTRFEQVDLDKLRLQIPKAKGGRREQPITAELADMLRREMAMRGNGRLDLPLASSWSQFFRTSRPDGKAVSECRRPRGPRSKDRHAARPAAHCDH